jgi:hypothetical protein
MSIDLYLHAHKVGSIFELLGTKENDMTYGLGWALAQSPGLLSSLLRSVFADMKHPQVDRVLLQEHGHDGGFTDIELVGPYVHVIVEAKRGWTLPTRKQLSCYVQRLPRTNGTQVALVTMSECSTGYASLHQDRTIEHVRVVHLPWNDLQRLCHIRTGTHAEKRLLAEFRVYLERIVKMQNQLSNRVYVVSLGTHKPKGCELSFREFATRRVYFHPFGRSGWPKEPPNYIGFRYEGRLQSIHHVESWKIVTDMHREISEIPPGEWGPHLIYALGPPIVPPHVVKTGKIYRNGRVWAALDLLLTCDTISEACDLAKKRLEIES